MVNLTILFGVFSRALQKKVHKRLKFSLGSFWTKTGGSNSLKIEAGNPKKLVINWCGLMHTFYL